MTLDAYADSKPGPIPGDKLPAIDVLTVICIAIVSYLLASVVHEGLGHGLIAAILGAGDLRLSSAALHLDNASISPQASRIISIAGPVTGLVVGLILALLHGNTRHGTAELRYCLWLTAYVCLFANSGYLMALSFFSFGDIHGFVKGLDSPFAWRLGLTIAGAVFSLVTLFFAGRTLDEFLGRNHRRARAAKLLLISYLAGSFPLILSTLLGRNGSFLALVSAIPATLGGTSFLLYTILAIGPALPSTSSLPLTPGKSLAWYSAGVMAILVYALVLGPGVPR
jgi:hypothetical protein